MHYYKKNIGDYNKKAARLSILQHGVYNLLMDAIYDRESFPSLDEAIDWIWASSNEEIEALKFVLDKFFELENGVYIQKRMMQTIQEYQGMCETNSVNGKRGGRPKTKLNKTQSVKNKTQSVNLDCESLPNRNPSESLNHKPLTTNQEPLTKLHKPIMEIFNNNLGEPLGKIRGVSPDRKKHLTARIKDDKRREDLQWWEDYFTFVSGCPHLIGQSPPRENGSVWKASFDWLINPNNMIKVIEGKYEQ